jgi:hypothetical protein
MCAVYLEEREEEEVKRVCLHFYDTQQLLLLFRLREAKGRLSNICFLEKLKIRIEIL